MQAMRWKNNNNHVTCQPPTAMLSKLSPPTQLQRRGPLGSPEHQLSKRQRVERALRVMSPAERHLATWVPLLMRVPYDALLKMRRMPEFLPYCESPHLWLDRIDLLLRRTLNPVARALFYEYRRPRCNLNGQGQKKLPETPEQFYCRLAERGLCPPLGETSEFGGRFYLVVRKNLSRVAFPTSEAMSEPLLLHVDGARVAKHMHVTPATSTKSEQMRLGLLFPVLYE